MLPVTVSLGKNATLRLLPSNRFTAGYYSVSFILPITPRHAAENALLAAMLRTSTAAYPGQKEMAKRLEELYDVAFDTAVARVGEAQVITFFVEMLGNRFSFDGTDITAGALSFLQGVLTDPYLPNGKFDQAYFEREKNQLIDQIRAAVNNKNAYALKRCREIMCEGEAYAVSAMGTEEDAAAITGEDLVAAYRRLLSEATVEIFYMGDDDPDVIRKASEALLARFPERKPCAVSHSPKNDVAAIKRITEPVDAVQGQLVLGFRVKAPADPEELMLFNAVYGGSATSKLFMNVREKLSLCYYCSSIQDAMKSVLFVYSGILNENAGKAETEILAQLSAVKEGNITEDEFCCAKEHLRGSLTAIYDNPSALAAWYRKRAILGDIATPEEVIARLDGMTVSRISAFAEKVVTDTVFFLQGTGKKGEEDDAEEN